MGNKPKKSKDGGGGVVSKTARASSGKGKQKQTAFQASGEINRIIPLADGHVYFLDPRDGRTHHFSTKSGVWQSFLQDILETEHGPRIQQELAGLGLGLG